LHAVKIRLFRVAAALLLASLPAAAALHTEAWDDHARTFHASPDRCPISTDHQCVACSIARLCSPAAAPIGLAAPQVSERLRERFAPLLIETSAHSFFFGRAPPDRPTS
jgi:hypothetical protein